MEFESFKKIPRIDKLNERVIITEKIDGTNACVAFDDAGVMWCGSRNRWLSDGKDNFGFRAWCLANEAELRLLGPGRHYGEWYGCGIGPHGYGLKTRHFALFNTRRWGSPGQTLPACVEVVPTLWDGPAGGTVAECVHRELQWLASKGSQTKSGFSYPRPEGVVVCLAGSDQLFKALLYTAPGTPKAHPSPCETLPEAA